MRREKAASLEWGQSDMLDVLQCAKCHSRMRILAAIHPSAAIQ